MPGQVLCKSPRLVLSRDVDSRPETPTLRLDEADPLDLLCNIPRRAVPQLLARNGLPRFSGSSNRRSAPEGGGSQQRRHEQARIN
eukprot:SAG11_NODE_2281_length_3575_cov_2.137802_6_plen_85_part_00